MKSELNKLRADVESLVGATANNGHADELQQHVQAMLSCPAAVEWELNFDFHHLREDEPGGQLDRGQRPERKIDFSGMTQEERGGAINKAYDAWLADHPHPLAKVSG